MGACDVKDLGAADTDPCHGLQIGGDPLTVDVTVHPVLPGVRTGLGRRIGEAGFEVVVGPKHGHRRDKYSR